MISYFNQIYKIIFLLLLTNSSNLYAHNLFNGGCHGHCGQKDQVINNENKSKEFDKDSCVVSDKYYFCRG